MENLDELTKEVLDLPLDQRAELAEKLLESLDQLTPEELEQVWAAEAERRLKAYREGDSRAVPADRVFKRAQELVR